jgi:hypothetical protein
LLKVFLTHTNHIPEYLEVTHILTHTLQNDKKYDENKQKAVACNAAVCYNTDD